ncbi:putative C6 finger domain protein [Talaromyces proteolyticus]|uniref:C6 finger domain protein n=1 Tax=Talaromyces proteolyticus TaxID=1131652 RepID=A0AAD4KGK8_9EURO|nr:putative C6 finger domain protein [Talaromyces proteolyticus]KAH8691255.1 putative C6 finger domain protein [Talaromyces proteolyticus]
MTQPYYSAGPSVGAYQDDPAMQYYTPNTYPAFPLLLGSGYVPESLAYWGSSTQQTSPAPVAGSDSTPHQQSRLAAVEQRKHKRTRSGCLTCRSRRIKCDEGRPICERCRKGNRDCEYPPPNAKSSSRSNKSRRQSSRGSISSDDETGDQGGLGVIPDEDESAGILSSPSEPALPKKKSMQSIGQRRPREASEASSASKAISQSPASDLLQASQSSSPFSSPQYKSNFVQQPARDLAQVFSKRQFKSGIRFLLKYHQERMSNNHYFLSHECNMFFRGTLFDLAMEYEPLLYALVGFAAYHHTLEKPDGKMYDFLKYYDRSLQLLRKSLASSEKHSEAMMATVLQLSTFEESIGDWVNLVDHHQAADALIHEMITPQSSTQNETHRFLLIWHSRFDLVAGLIAKNEAILSREWYTTIDEHDAAQAALSPDDLTAQLRLVSSRTRLFAMDYASLFARLGRQLVSFDDFVKELNEMDTTVHMLHQVLEQYDNCPEITMPRPAVPLQGPEDVLDTAMPCRFYRDSMWRLNFAWADLLSTELMYKYQTHISIGRPEGPELQRIALQICHHAESIVRWPEVDVGTVIAFHNWLVLTAMFLPRDPKHMMWSRRMIARIEINGYIYPPKVRESLAELWGDQTVHQWWVPDEGGCPELVKEIRTLTEERTTNPRDKIREDVRDMKSLFSKMRLDDVGSQGSSPLSGTLTGSSPAQSSPSGQAPP